MISIEKVKELTKLQQKKYRDSSNTFIVEGTHLVKEADMHGIILEKYSLDKEKGFIQLPMQVMKKICCTDSVVKQIAVCKKIQQEKITNNILILDRIQDPGNMGTIMRTAVAFNFQTIFLADGCVDIYNDKVIRASQGAIFKLNYLFGDPNEFIDELNEYTIYGTNVEKGIELSNIKKVPKVAIVLGNEGQGISKELQEKIKDHIYIKMNNTESLNVSIAAAIIMYELSK